MTDNNCDDIILDNDDLLNKPFEKLHTISDVVFAYQQHAKSFYLDEKSGGERERVEQYIKFVLTLLTPQED